ncbi:5,6-dimethylbenzimidazole synthase [Lichenicoccus sp.]|uniref:5,6-dimethylbenzimidazole synthase n=1 Tax=Lichenicoccus sp. TaxID=2781899 RepID=UPI003D0C64E6
MPPPCPPPFDDGFRRHLHTLFCWRRDVRHFRTDPLPALLQARLLASCALAPSVGLSEPWRLVAVDDPDRRAAVRRNFLASNHLAQQAVQAGRAQDYARLKLAGLDQAPWHLAVFCESDPAQGGGLGRQSMPETLAFSAVMAIHTLWLAARAEGVGLGWVSILDAGTMTSILDVPPEWRFIAYLCLGYPAAEDDVPELERAGWEVRGASGAAVLQR